MTALRMRTLSATLLVAVALTGCSKVPDQTVTAEPSTKTSTKDSASSKKSTDGTGAGSFAATEVSTAQVNPAPASATTTPYRPAASRVRLVAYTSCASGLNDIKAEALRIVTPYGLPQSYGSPMAVGGAERTTGTPGSGGQTDSSAGGSAPPSPTSSGTNVQEAGVDEPDVAKTDGRRLVTTVDGSFRVLDVSSGDPRPVGSLAMPDAYGASILLQGDRALVFTQSFEAKPQPQPSDTRGGFAPYPQGTPRTVVRVIDITGPRVISTVSLEGSMVDARLVGGVARIVLNTNSQGPPMTQPAESGADAENAALQENKRRISASSLGDWIPDYKLTPASGEGRSGTLSTCTHVHRPEGEPSGMGMVSVVGLDPLDPTPRAGETVIGGGEVIYGSLSSVYVTSSAYSSDGRSGGTTRIHRFDITDAKRSTYKGSGSVPGWVRSQWSISEHAGHLRVATTRWGTQPTSDGRSSSDSIVTVLALRADALEVVGSVSGLGPGEQIQGVRFIGDRGYVVTFRQIDPLHVIDLSDPKRPRLLGELHVPGYSAYLHPVSEHHLLGVGIDADDEGRRTGVQVALYDVTNPSNPTQLDRWTVANRYSMVESTHHAFLWWAPKDLAVVPTTGQFASAEPRPADDPSGGGTDGGSAPEQQRMIDEAIGLRVVGDHLVEAGRITHVDRAARPEMATIQRSLVVGPSLITVSAAGVMSSNLDGFGVRAWVDFAS